MKYVQETNGTFRLFDEDTDSEVETFTWNETITILLSGILTELKKANV